MTRTLLTPFLSIISYLLLITGSYALAADQEVITDDGRAVLLKEDGNWVFRSTDRFANTKDGRRVRLQDDGSWQYVGTAPQTSKQQVRTTNLDIKLQKVVVETYEKKVQKNVRTKTQTVFYLDLALPPQARDSIMITENDIALIAVKDNKGRDYPVVAIQPISATLEPGSNTTVVLRAKGAPSWLKPAKKMSVIFNPGAFGMTELTTLSQSVDDFEEKDVEGFEKE